MNLLRTSALNGLAVAIKLGTVLLLNKVLAVFVGPTGYAVIGQFQSVVTMASTFASGAVNVGVTKYTAEYGDDPKRQAVVWRTAATMGLCGAAVFAALLVALRAPLAQWALGDAGLSSVVIWLAASLALLVLNGLMLAILNGRKAVVPYVAANIAGSLVGAASAVLLVTRFGLYGALVAVAINQALACGVTAWLFHKACPLPWRALVGPIDGPTARRLFGYALMSLTTAIVVPASQIAIRDGLASRLGWHDTGLWQAMWKISETHLLLLTSTLSVYFLPRFSEIRDASELRREVARGYRFVLPLVCASALLLYLLREVLIRTLLTPAFLPIAGALGLQLVGDVLKIGSWVMAFTMVSHAQTRVFIVTECAFSAFLAVTTLLLGERFGLVGTAGAYALTYALYWLVMAGIFARLISRLKRDASSPEVQNSPCDTSSMSF
jgi:PST family polysaccharide transporter